MSYLMECPVEIVLIISEYISKVDRICLSLTCKALFCIIGVPNKTELKSPIKKMLLYRLEKAIPGVCYCQFRNKLIPFDRTNLPGLYDFGIIYKFERFSPGYYYLRMLRFPSSTFALSYHAARLITNYGLLGPEHGVPPSCLSYLLPGDKILYHWLPTPSRNVIRYDRNPNDIQMFWSLKDPEDRDQIYWRESWKAKLIGGDLFLSATHSRFHSEAEGKALQNSFNRCGFICMHTAVQPQSENKKHAANFPDIDGKLSKDSGYHSTGWCRFCMTDWDLSIQWEGPSYGWVIVIKTYHDLGNCRSPFHWKWKAINMPTNKRAKRNNPGGIVKSRWLAEEGFDRSSFQSRNV
ncbi:hypothetical protein F4804DRAFT_336536 [Jackrogersella minutella]|nr:hypothetical protein F4804DRAFT_336536 [Jackrogersella minutella]